jgi:hypothetical protein
MKIHMGLLPRSHAKFEKKFDILRRGSSVGVDPWMAANAARGGVEFDAGAGTLAALAARV